MRQRAIRTPRARRAGHAVPGDRAVRVLMIYPEIPTTYWSFRYALPFAGKKAQFPPLGLITVAALLPAGYEARLVDMNVTALTRRDIEQADVVFISAMIVQKESFHRVVARCRAMGKTIVAGGPYPSSSYDSIAGVDHFVLNESEDVLREFLRDFADGHARLVYAAEERPDIAATPVPRFDLLEVDAYFSMALQYSRGCPFNCEFCDIIEMFGRTPRTKSVEQFIGEVQALYDTGYRGSLFIVDDNFIGNKGAVRALLPRLAAWQMAHGYPFSLFTEASVNLADDAALMAMMLVAGFDMVFLGIETPVEETLVQAQKSQNTRGSLIESVRRIQRAGLEVSAGFIIGFDTDPADIFDRQISFIQESGIVMAMIGLMMALPNTQLHRRLRAENRLVRETSGNNTHDMELNFVPVMDQRAIVDGYRRVIRTIYSPRNYFRRCLTMMEHVPKHPLSYRRLQFKEVRAFLHSLVRQGLSSYGPAYLAFLLRVILRNRAYFPEAVRMAIMGHHFFMMTRDLLRVDADRPRPMESPVGDAAGDGRMSPRRLHVSRHGSAG